MKDYRVEVKVKNNYLFSMMNSYGIENIPQLSKATGLSLKVLYPYLNLTRTPYTKTGTLTRSVNTLCNFFSCTVYDLFPPQHIENPLEKNSGFIEASMTELVSSNLLEGGTNPLELLEKQDIPVLVNSALEKLNSRQRLIIESRFGLNGEGEKTLSEVAELLGVSTTRIREIEAKAMRKLRGTGYTSDLAYACSEGAGELQETLERGSREIAKRELMEAEKRRAMKERQEKLELEKARKRFMNLQLVGAYDRYTR